MSKPTAYAAAVRQAAADYAAAVRVAESFTLGLAAHARAAALRTAEKEEKS